METEHLYLPYCAVPYGPNEFHIVDGGGDTVAVTKPVYGYPGHDEKIAAYICRAVNAHDALVEACRGFLSWFDHMPEDNAIAHGVELVTRLRDARAALALAEGGAE